MSETSWLKSKQAICMANLCIDLVRKELNVRLSPTHPHFLDLLKQYVELTDSSALHSAYHELINYAGLKASNFRANAQNRSIIEAEPQTNAKAVRVTDTEYLIYKGRPYKRYENGMEFQGLYRGQPYYA